MSKYEFMKQVETVLKTSNEAVGCMITSSTYIRNNDICRYGISITKEHERIAPTFYVDNYYDDYQRKKITVEETALDILLQMKKLSGKEVDESKLDLKFEDFESSIVYRLISTDRNKKLLENTPNLPFLNLSIIFTIVFSNTDSGIETIRITDEIKDRWGVSTSDLMKLASVNTPRILPSRMQSLSSVMSRFLELDLSDDSLDPVIHIVSNSLSVYGATTLLYPDMPEVIAGEVGGSYYVLPSSVHEVLILPESGDEDRDTLSSMVSQINDEHVRDEEVLSDIVYYYNAIEKRFEF